MEISWYGNAVVKITHGDITLVTDPFVSRNPEHRKLTDDDLRGSSAFLITHGHFDHVIDVPGFCERLDVPVYAPPKVSESLRSKRKMNGLLKTATIGEDLIFSGVKATSYSSEHVKFDLPLIGETLAQVLVRSTLPNRFSVLGKMLSDHLAHPMGQCVGWLIEADGKRLLHFGSLALDRNEVYPLGVDLLSLPYQGNSKLHELVVQIVEKLQPKRVYLQHFDNTFPPLSQDVPTNKAVELMATRFPDIDVVVPDYRSPLAV
jgi:L-ascorbate metabolism protein UlaG (beta-lactamase superfamily)